MMTREEYAKLRKAMGTQVAVAKELGIDEKTLKRREGGQTPLSNEAVLAMRLLWVMTAQGILC